MKYTILFITLSLSIFHQAHGQKYELSVGLGASIGWFRGKGQLDIPFSKTVLPTFQVDYRQRLGERHRLLLSGSLDAIQSVYRVNTFDIDLQPTTVDNALSVDYLTISMQYQYILIPTHQTAIGAGIFYGFVDRSVMGFDYNNKIKGGAYSPYYAELLLKQSIGIQFHLRQPIFKYGWCRFDLEGIGQIGLNNANNNPYFSRPDPIYTRHFSLSLHTVLIPPKRSL